MEAVDSRKKLVEAQSSTYKQIYQKLVPHLDVLFHRKVVRKNIYTMSSDETERFAAALKKMFENKIG